MRILYSSLGMPLAGFLALYLGRTEPWVTYTTVAQWNQNSVGFHITALSLLERHGRESLWKQQGSQEERQDCVTCFEGLSLHRGAWSIQRHTVTQKHSLKPTQSSHYYRQPRERYARSKERTKRPLWWLLKKWPVVPMFHSTVSHKRSVNLSQCQQMSPRL